MKSIRRSLLVLLIFMFCFLRVAGAHGNPVEHAKMHPGEKTQSPAVKSVQKAVMNYIKANSKADRTYLFKDSRNNKIWTLKFDKLHPVRKINDQHYFFCADFKVVNAPSGEKARKLDLDFFLSLNNKKWDVTNVWLHKVDGTAVAKSYVCPMHRDIGTNFPGKCPVCGMKMEKVK